MTAARIPDIGRGPTRARRPVGELALVPDVPRQVRTITLVVEQLDGGRLRMMMPKAPGWVVVGRTPVEIVRALRSAFTEAQVASFSDWRGTVYDQGTEHDHLAAPQLRRHKPRSRGKRRPDVFDPVGWLVDERGKWVSPGAGHRYPETSQVVRRVMAARKAMGLPERPGPDDSRQRLEQITGTQLAMRLEEST